MNRGIELPQLGKATLISTEFLEGVFPLLFLTINTSQNSTDFFFKLIKQENVSVVMNQDMAPTK